MRNFLQPNLKRKGTPLKKVLIIGKRFRFSFISEKVSKRKKYRNVYTSILTN